MVHSTRSASDKVYQLLAHGRWFSPGTPASSTTKTGRHDIAELIIINHYKKMLLVKFIYWLTICIYYQRFFTDYMWEISDQTVKISTFIATIYLRDLKQVY
jgi:hypothetical protein